MSRSNADAAPVVRLSKQHRITLPAELVEAAGLTPSQALRVEQWGDGVRLIPVDREPVSVSERAADPAPG